MSIIWTTLKVWLAWTLAPFLLVAAFVALFFVLIYIERFLHWIRRKP